MIENIKKLALLLVVTIICVACDKKETGPIIGEPPELKSGLIRQMSIPYSIKNVEVVDYSELDTKVLHIVTDSEIHEETSDKFKKICDNYSIDYTVPYLIPEGWRGISVIGGEIKNIELKCMQDFNLQYEAEKPLNPLLTLYYSDITESLYDYKKLSWEKSETGKDYGWLFRRDKEMEINGSNEWSMLMPRIRGYRDFSLSLSTLPAKPGTYDFILSMTVFSPIYGEKKMEKEFSMTWE